MWCSIHKGFCIRQGISSPISDLTERLLLEERDPPAVPQESFYEAPPFDEVRFLIFNSVDLSCCWETAVSQWQALFSCRIIRLLNNSDNVYFIIYRQVTLHVLCWNTGGHTSTCTCRGAYETRGNWQLEIC